jgi:Uma2 family endonuclease
VGTGINKEGIFMLTRPRVVDAPRRLIDGERLDQPTFDALYEAMPPGTRAELINGVVHMLAPHGVEHGQATVRALVWLGLYEANTPGIQALANASTALGFRSELQPDGLLRILPEFGGRTLNEANMVAGVPELLVEVAHTSRYADLGPKFDDYAHAGVLEYVVRSIEPDEVRWFILRRGRLVELTPSSDGLYRSEVFPGLWLDVEALLAGDIRKLQAVVDQGCATPEHAAFVSRLAEKRSSLRQP